MPNTLSQEALQRRLRHDNPTIRGDTYLYHADGLSQSQIEEGLKDPDPMVRKAVICSEVALTSFQIQRAIDDLDPRVRMAVFWRELPFSQAQIQQGLDDADAEVRSGVLSGWSKSRKPQLTRKQFQRVLEDKDSEVRRSAFSYCSAEMTTVQLERGLEDPEPRVRETVILRAASRLTPRMLEKAMNDPVGTVANLARSLSCLRRESQYGLKSRDVEVRVDFFSNLSITPSLEQIELGLSDTSESVRLAVLERFAPDLNPLLLQRGLNDSDPFVRSRVVDRNRDQLTDADFRKVLTDPYAEVRVSALDALLLSHKVTDKGKEFKYLVDGPAIDPEPLLALRRPQDLCRLLLGSAHPTEQAALFNDPKHALKAIKVLRAAHTDPNTGRHDRHQTLQQLRFLLENNLLYALAYLTATQWWDALDLIGEATLLDLHEALNFQVWGVIDTFRAASAIMWLSGRSRKETIKTLRKWISEHGLARFHDYVIAIAKDLQGSEDFPQATLDPESLGVNLPATLRLFLPRNRGDLRILSTTQHHCVGQDAQYTQDVLAGDRVIFALSPTEKSGAAALSRGWTFEYDATGMLQQAEGFANKPEHRPPTKVRDVADAVAQRLVSALTPHVRRRLR